MKRTINVLFVFRDIFSFLYDRNNVVPVGLVDLVKETDMSKKYLKAFGNGMIWGIKHPFKEVYMTDRYDDMKFTEMICDSLGVATVQTCLGYGIFIAGLIALGYANEKIQNKPVKVNMVIDKEKKK